MITVVGVGGGGNNTVCHLARTGTFSDIQLMIANTDFQHMQNSRVKKILLGKKGSSGHGAGSKPEKGKEAAEESYENIVESLRGSDLVVISAGLGGGTGTGASPIFAKAAKECGALTVAVVTKPFLSEGSKRERLAMAGLKELYAVCDSIVVIPNQKLLSVIAKNTSYKESMSYVDDVAARAVNGISSVILSHSDDGINVDVEDLRTIMSHRGLALMGIGEATGENAAEEAERITSREEKRSALNAIMADSLAYAADWLEREMASGVTLKDAIQSFITHVMEEHSAVIFNGDGYSEIWHKEAERRGLPNLHNTPEAIPVLQDPEVVELYERLGIMNPAEIRARVEIYLGQYCKTLRTEATLTVRMSRQSIFPAALNYQKLLAETCVALKAMGREFKTTTLDVVTDGIRALQEKTNELEARMEAIEGETNLESRSKRYCEEVLPVMNEVRAVADRLECIIPEDMWTLPTYQEMLFNK